MKPANFKWTTLGDLMIGYGTAGKVDNDVWTAYVQDLETKPISRYLGIMNGSFEVNSIQRKASADAAKKRKIKVVIVTDDRLVRGLVTAVSWMGTDIKAFSASETAEALKYLKVTGPALLRAQEAIRELKVATEGKLAK